jgi:FdhE protein
MTQDIWLATHPYLQPVADFQGHVATVSASLPMARSAIPDWDDYRHDYQKGIPLLRSSQAAIDFEPVEQIVVLLLEKLNSFPPKQLAGESRDLDDQLRCEVDAPRRALGWLLGRDVFEPRHPGLLRYLGWTALARFLGPVVSAFNHWRDEDQWLRPYCPTCGSAPAMSQLVNMDSGHCRLLSCGCCLTRWRFQRMGCPFCEAQDTHRLTVLGIAGEANLRIDYCESCHAYLKTYTGEGNEAIFLADWTSLHLDLVACDHGLKRLAASLYEL